MKFGWKKPEQKIVRPDTIGVPYNPHTFMVEALLIQNDMDKPSALKDNVLYYIAGHLVRSLLPVQCQTCQDELLWNAQDSHTFGSTMPSFARFAAHKQKGGLILPSAFAFKIVKTTECIFHRRVLEQGIGITKDTKLFCKIQSAVIEQFDHTLSDVLHHTLFNMLSWQKLIIGQQSSEQFPTSTCN